jgi:DNA-binding transcriptional LysR family regulator
LPLFGLPEEFAEDSVMPGELLVGTGEVRAGEVLANRAKRLLSTMSSIELEVRTFGGEHQEIEVGAFATAGVDLLPELSLASRRDDVVIRELSVPEFVRRVTVVTLPGAIRAIPALGDFLDVLDASVAATPPG